ncbi:DNA polymerase Y family protein [Dyadobacter sp. CY261]|uniref:Y-family DNA polymerase n=1 Tax=Dyadobacter sp. CY261 TaxID=2907203 RepID=UPI001F2B6A7D|nr:DNA polymerase Y family protein [Dyadobacter sp. CY261]MCF0071130.1 DNA polymerase Y family protein [Dyadobacter sp. CY261]
MPSRFISIWFPNLATDHWIRIRPELYGIKFALAAPEHGRMVVKAVSEAARIMGIETNMVVADARAIFPALVVLDYEPEVALQALRALAEWCIRYTPTVALDSPDGLILDTTGCAYLWGDERAYLNDLVTKLGHAGYHIRAAMADTIGVAWAHAHFGRSGTVIPSGAQYNALLPLPSAALRLSSGTIEKMQKLGFYQIRNFIRIPARVLRRRFGPEITDKLSRALGYVQEFIDPVRQAVPYQERLPCLEPIVTATGIEIALQKLLEMLCTRLMKEGKGLRSGVLTCFRVDGKTQQIDIVTNRASHHVKHLFRLFELKIKTIAPGFGIELFILEAPEVEDIAITQGTMWDTTGGFENSAIAELLDAVTGRVGTGVIQRYLPDEHHWPERSVKLVTSLQEKPKIDWRTDRQRPVFLLPNPESIIVTAPVPDYPPTVFRYKDNVHYIDKSEGPERIEQEWWLQQGLYRDYYTVEDREGRRYWLFRLGPNPEDEDERKAEWFIHGFFA